MSIKTKLKSAVVIYKNKGFKSLYRSSIELFIRKFLIRKILNYYVFLAKTSGDKFSFHNHYTALSQRYDPAVSLSFGKLSDNLLVELQELIKTVGDESAKKFRPNSQIHNNLLLGDYFKEVEIDQFEESIIVHPLHLIDPLTGPIHRLHKELRTIFVNDIKSPFVFVNTRAWSTRPNSAQFGPNSLHKDGFEPGHMKIMIYLTPFNEEYGCLTLENEKITDYPEGTCVCFSNSDILHAGVPGTKYRRTAIEVTLMRAFIDAPQFNNGHFFGRHYTRPEVAYQISSKLVSKFAQKENIESFDENDVIS